MQVASSYQFKVGRERKKFGRAWPYQAHPGYATDCHVHFIAIVDNNFFIVEQCTCIGVVGQTVLGESESIVCMAYETIRNN